MLLLGYMNIILFSDLVGIHWHMQYKPVIQKLSNLKQKYQM